MFLAADAARAADLDWGTRPSTNIVAGDDVATVDGMTVTTSGAFFGSSASRVMQIFPTSTYNTHVGVIGMQMDATTDDGSAYATLTFTFSRPVTNLSFTVVDIDGGTTGSWNDRVAFSPIPALVSNGSNVSWNAGTGIASSNGSAIDGTQGDVRINFAGPVTSVTMTWYAWNASGTNPANQTIFVDDLSFTIVPQVALQKVSRGGTGTFSFAQTNLASTPAAITTTVVDTATPASPTPVNVNTIGTAVTLTETPASGFRLSAASCIDANSAVTGNTATIGTLSGNTLTIPAAAVVEAASFECTLTNTRALLRLQKVTQGGVGGPFTFAQANLASTPAGITTTAVNTAAPASPTPINITTIGTAVTLTETMPAGFAITGASCTDANSAVTGNTGSFGSLSGTTLTIPAGNVVAGADLICTFTNRRVPTVSVQKVTQGAVGGPFTFAQTNLASAPAGITTTAVNTAAPVSPTAINVTTIGSAVTLTETVAAGFAITGATCTDANSAVTGNTGSIGTLSGNTLTIPAGNVVAGAQFNCVFTNRRIPTVSVQKITQGAVGGPFTFAQTNLASTPAGITTTAVNTAAPVSPTAINVTTVGTAVTLTETLATGFAITSAACTDANSAVTGNTGSIGTLSGSTLTIPAGNVVAGAQFNCTFTNRAIPTVSVQKITQGAVGGPFTFAQTNLASTPANITTTAVNTAAPVSPTAINVTAVGTAVTLTETVAAGFAITSATCTDANSAVTGNTGSIDTLAGNTLTIPAGNVVAGAQFNCTFTNRRIPTVSVQKVTQGAVGGPFTFAQTNLASAPAGITTTAVNTAAPASPTPINVTTVGTAVTLTETIAAGFAITSAICTDVNSAVTSNTGSIGTLSGNTLTIPAVNVVAGAQFNCTFTNRKIPSVRIQKITQGGFGGPFTFAQTNLATTPAGITTSAANTATPASPTAHLVTTMGSNVTLTETVAAGYFISGAVCIDANSAVTGNTGAIGTLSGTTLTIPGANVVIGADFTCTFTNTLAAPALQVTKSASVASVDAAGDQITYTITVANTGNVTVSTITVSDPLGTVTCAISGNSTIATLAPGGSTTCTLIYTVPQSVIDSNGGGDGDIDNTATASGTYGVTVVQATGSTSVAIITNPAMTVTKVANDTTDVVAGQVITYTYVVTNTGNQTLTNIALNDAHDGSGPPPVPGNETLTTDGGTIGDSTDATASNGVWSVLAPGDAVTFTATYTVTQNDVDTKQ